MKPGEHGPDKLYDKFRVFRAKTGEELTGRGEFMFVLRPETNDQAAVQALMAYARACEHSYPQLAQDIMAELRRIEDEVTSMALETGVSLEQAYRARSDDRPGPPMMLPRNRPICPHCGAMEGAICLNSMAGKACELESGNG